MSYRRGAAVLSSDSASTLAIVKELISKEATARRVHITDSFQVWGIVLGVDVICRRGRGVPQRKMAYESTALVALN